MRPSSSQVRFCAHMCFHTFKLPAAAGPSAAAGKACRCSSLRAQHSAPRALPQLMTRAFQHIFSFFALPADLHDFCSHAADHEDKRLVLAGLDGDFQRRRFGQVGGGC